MTADTTAGAARLGGKSRCVQCSLPPPARTRTGDDVAEPFSIAVLAALRSAGCRRLLGLALALAAVATAAHPLGNSSVNRQAAIAIAPDQVELDYLLDLAEIPALAAAIEADGDSDGVTAAAEWERWTQAQQEEIRRSLQLRLDEQDLALQPLTQEWRLNPGQAGLPILRLRLRYRAAFAAPPGGAALSYRDRYLADRAGWQEIFLSASHGVTVTAADVPDHDRSNHLTDFSRAAGEPAPRELRADARLTLAAASTEGSAPLEREDTVESRDDPAAAPPQPAAGRWSEAWHFYRLGLHHIAAGFDHLAFLLGLLLTVRRLGQVVRVITAFTVAHSLTLALAANHWIAAPGALVEAAIAASIVYVGACGLSGCGRGHSLYLAFGFGLVHGLGFAGALAESLGTGSRSGRWWLSDLAAFNLGIESLQLVFAAVAFALANRCRSQAWARPAGATASVAVMAAGLGWLVERVGA